MQLEKLTVERRGAIALVRFVNPPEGLMSIRTVTDLTLVAAEVDADPEIRCVVFTGGQEGVFIKHYDVAEIAAAARAAAADPGAARRSTGQPRAIDMAFGRIDHLRVPTIAAINGNCAGGGCEFALCCDLRLMERGAHRIGLPEVTVGIFPGAGGTWRLRRAVGESWALRLILAGDTLDPDAAARIGLVHEVVEGPVLPAALALAERIAALSPRAVADAKRMVKGEPPPGFVAPEQWREAAAFGRLLAESPEAAALMARYVGSSG